MAQQANLGKLLAAVTEEFQNEGEPQHGHLIKFGQAMRGKTYQEAATNKRWVHFLVSTANTKGEIPLTQTHFFKYLENAILDPSEAKEDEKGQTSTGKVNVKTEKETQKGLRGSQTGIEFFFDDWEEEAFAEKDWGEVKKRDMLNKMRRFQDTLVQARAECQEMNSRLNQMETALAQLFQHLEIS